MTAKIKLSKVAVIVTISIVRGMNLRKVLLNQQKKPLSKKRKIAEKSKEETMLDQAMSILAKEPDAAFWSKYRTIFKVNSQQTYKRMRKI